MWNLKHPKIRWLRIFRWKRLVEITISIHFENLRQVVLVVSHIPSADIPLKRPPIWSKWKPEKVSPVESGMDRHGYLDDLGVCFFLIYETQMKHNQNWLVVSTHLKNISENGNLPQIGVKIKHFWNHHLENNLPQSSFSKQMMKYGRWPETWDFLTWKSNGWRAPKWWALENVSPFKHGYFGYLC